ncbi:response regulator receiver domain protein [Synechococcus sp. PCC 7335]|uniref:response regulator n=1 Tax=Synechococcus sp. (strain ATCC 29403 / PCC 7335) TaxID=91464 RepID=UPI00017EB4BE|nr:response regulator [Synechococcus sp. PCC 7335]EDX86399.1 response regulator receiver domain protein [Synechococcus sp. PCC 7335]
MTTELDAKPIHQSAPPKKRIMVVEDESVIALDIISSLTRLGYDVAGKAASGDSALRKIQNSRPDLILMDIHIKGEMTGIDISEKVKSEFQIPIVYLTANADDSTFKQANQTEPYGYLLKPFEERELSIAIEIALHKHEQEQVIRSSEHWYATAFQSLSEAVMATDRHGNVIFMNAMAESITDWSLQEALDRPIADVLKFRSEMQKSDTSDTINSSQAVGLRSVRSIVKAILEGTDVVQLPAHTQLLPRSKQAVSIVGHVVAIRDTIGDITGCLFTFRTPVITAQTKSSNSSLDTSKESQPPLITKTPSTTSELIGDREIDAIKTFIDSFVSKQPTHFTSGELTASYDHASATLTSQTQGDIVIGKLVRGTQTAIVNRNSDYWEAVCHHLIVNSFFPVSQRTNGTCYFQHCTVPKNCQVYRTHAQELWEVWHGKACPKGDETASATVSRANLMVLRRGSWYHVQSLTLADDMLKIQTIGGEIFISRHDLLVWGTQRWR